AGARARLTQRTARDADSLVVLATVRRDAGDASELDVQLAMVFAGQAANIAATDSLNALSALLAVQTAMGQPADTVRIALADSLALPGPLTTRATAIPTLQVAA